MLAKTSDSREVGRKKSKLWRFVETRGTIEKTNLKNGDCGYLLCSGTADERDGARGATENVRARGGARAPGIGREPNAYLLLP